MQSSKVRSIDVYSWLVPPYWQNDSASPPQGTLFEHIYSPTRVFVLLLTCEIVGRCLRYEESSGCIDVAGTRRPSISTQYTVDMS